MVLRLLTSLGLLQVLNERIQTKHVDKQFVVADEHWTNESCVTEADVHYLPVFRVLVLGVGVGRGGGQQRVHPTEFLSRWLHLSDCVSSLIKGESRPVF